LRCGLKTPLLFLIFVTTEICQRSFANELSSAMHVELTKNQDGRVRFIIILVGALIFLL
jgi:hypothetical protein